MSLSRTLTIAEWYPEPVYRPVKILARLSGSTTKRFMRIIKGPFGAPNGTTGSTRPSNNSKRCKMQEQPEKKVGTVRRAIQFVDQHRGSALFLGGLSSVTLGATWWLAKGGAAAFITSMTALGTPDVAQTLKGLPEYHRGQEAKTEAILSTLAAQNRAIEDIANSLHALRSSTERVVVWDAEVSQSLTDQVGGCYAGQGDCQVFMRGRLTEAANGCEIVYSRPFLVQSDGQEFPIEFGERHQPVQLTARPETISMWIEVPSFIQPGSATVFAMDTFAECPFAAEGEIVSRSTVRLNIEINDS